MWVGMGISGRVMVRRWAEVADNWADAGHFPVIHSIRVLLLQPSGKDYGPRTGHVARQLVLVVRPTSWLQSYW